MHNQPTGQPPNQPTDRPTSDLESHDTTENQSVQIVIQGPNGDTNL